MNIFGPNYFENMIKFLLPTENEAKEFEISITRLADIGWALPIHFSHKMTVELANDSNADDEIAERFRDFYTANDNKQLQELVIELIKDESLRQWHPLIQECYLSFIDGRHLVTVPALITAVEGVLAQKLGILKSQKVRMISPTKAKRNEQENYSLDKAIWISVLKLVENLYDNKRDFSGNDPDFTNRHWILHGRNSQQWGAVDSIRLFNLLGSLTIA